MDVLHDPASTHAQRQRERYWQRTRRLTALLLLLWAGVSFGMTWFARDLSFSFFGWPFSFWVASQGALIVYLMIVVVHARRMARLDAEFREDPERD